MSHSKSAPFLAFRSAGQDTLFTRTRPESAIFFARSSAFFWSILISPVLQPAAAAASTRTRAAVAGRRTETASLQVSDQGVRATATMSPSAALALPPPPPALFRPGGRPGAHSPHAAQRDRAREGPPRLPVRRLARHRQDQHGEAPGLRAQRRGRGTRRLLARRPARASDHDRAVTRRGRDGRGLEQL